VPSRIFVFGSNRSGRHGKGAALFARQNHGAIYGQGEGRQGDSYAIPTKDESLDPLTLDEISDHVHIFLGYARAHPELLFEVTRVGCGLAGYSDSQIAPMFRSLPANCVVAPEWLPYVTG
jgi:hypothetical protein